MEIIVNPERSRWGMLTRRVTDSDELIKKRVAAIVERVKEQGDDALRQLALEIDGCNIESLEVSQAEFEQSEKEVTDDIKDAVKIAAANIRRFHEAQHYAGIEVETVEGVKCLQRSVPISRVGLYIPGGSAPLFSTVLMLAIPAKVAACGEVIMCTPTDKSGRVAPTVLYAARFCGIDRVFKVGGAQAIAAMAYGTGTIPAVDKIFGPGNRYVTSAKQLVSVSEVAIDMPAGPSEVMVMADESAEPAFVAADLLSQAEHGADSQAMLVCLDKDFAIRTIEEIERQKSILPRNEIVDKSLFHSRIIVFDNVNTMIDFANCYASEHLIISMSEPWKVAMRITSAGSVFVGNYSPESAGDYASGTNHTLPTSGWAKTFSGVNLDSYMRKITYQELSADGLGRLSKTIIDMACAEGLDAHANAVRVRLQNK